MLFFFPRRPVLTSEQFERVSNILDNMGQVFFGMLVLTPLVQGIDKTNIWLLVLVVVDVVICWAFSLLLARRKDD
jgi:hypothetical protein